jgi:arginine deiminase
LLFDDVLSVSKAKAEHDAFCDVMRDRGVEVFEAERLLAEALGDSEARERACGHILSERDVGITAAQRAREWAGSADPAVVAVADHHRLGYSRALRALRLRQPPEHDRIEPRVAVARTKDSRERKGNG